MFPPQRVAHRLFLSSKLFQSSQLQSSHHLRLFTQKSQLLLISPASPRPQLPFLHSPPNLRTPRNLNRNPYQVHLARLLTTESKNYIKEQLWGAVKFVAYCSAFAALGSIALFGAKNELLERQYPTPREWTWVSRYSLRNAWNAQDPEIRSDGLVDWASAGGLYRFLLRRLEDPELDGKDLHPRLGDGEDIYVEGIGKTGFSISSKSEPWRRGYHECLMGAARAAEHLDTWVRDKTRNMAFSSEFVIGPSNPRPRPVPYNSAPAPLEENCEPAFAQPQVYYMKILTTDGFTTRQRMEAALAYASWLEFKGLSSSAEAMYSWALDIAVDGLPPDSKNAVNPRTGVIVEGAQIITDNLLLATSSLATHHAQNGKLSAALPIFLSILRAQRNLPLSTPKILPSKEENSLATFSGMLSFLEPVEYPPPPPSGDDPTTRSSVSTCSEAGTMVHIGEVLFASSALDSDPSIPLGASESSGLAWTRSAVSLAENTLLSLSASPTSPGPITGPREVQNHPREPRAVISEAKERCAECLTAGMENWAKMVAKLQRIEATERASGLTAIDPTRHGQSGLRSWFWGNGIATPSASPMEGKWEHEARAVKEKSQDIRQLLRQEGVSGEERKRGQGGGFWLV